MASRSLPKVRRLLYVDNDPASVVVVEQFVAAGKHLVLLRAEDLDLGLKLARRQPPEVMLIDIDQAGIGAVELMKMLRANPATQATPAVALSADAASEAAVKALEAGFFHYLVKPLQTGPLTEALDYALEFAALERAEL
jgi:CheY-like chemotaxis protein